MDTRVSSTVRNGWTDRVSVQGSWLMWVQETMYYRGSQDQTNQFAATRGDKSAMRAFANLLWTLNMNNGLKGKKGFVTERWARSWSWLQAVSPQLTISHPPSARLPLLSARPAVTFPAAEHYSPLAGTKLHCLVTEAHRCEQFAQGCYAAFAPSMIWNHDLLITRPTLYSLRHRAI